MCYVGVFVEDETEPNAGVVVLVCGLVQAGQLPSLWVSMGRRREPTRARQLDSGLVSIDWTLHWQVGGRHGLGPRAASDSGRDLLERGAWSQAEPGVERGLYFWQTERRGR